MIFTLVVPIGRIGLNLKSCKCDKGTFVYSYYRGTKNNVPDQIILPAEAYFGDALIGTIVTSINEVDVAEYNSTQCCQLIAVATRPLKITFELPSYFYFTTKQSLTNPLIMPWILAYSDTILCSEKLIDHLAIYLNCWRILQNYAVFYTGHSSDEKNDNNLLHDVVLSMFQSCQTVGNIELISDQLIMESYSDLSLLFTNVPNIIGSESTQRVMHRSTWDLVHMLQRDAATVINDFILPGFHNSLYFKRMVGSLHNYDKIIGLNTVPNQINHNLDHTNLSINITIDNILKNAKLMVYFILFLSRNNR